MTKKLLALLLAALMCLSVLTACAGNTNTTDATVDTTTTDNSSTPPQNTQNKDNDTSAVDPTPAEDTTEPADEPSDIVDAEILEAGEAKTLNLNAATLPVADELTTLTAWRSYDTYGEWTDFNDSDYRKAIAEATNIDLEFTTATAATASEKFGLMLVSQDYTDLMAVPNLNALKSGDAAIEDEIVVDLRDYEESLYPNYAALCNSSTEVYKATRTDSGAMWGFFTLLKEPEGAWTGLAYRTDLAADCGYTGGDPVTIADWEELLKAYKEGGVEVPLAFPRTAVFAYGAFASAFDAYAGYYAENGTDVKYGYIQDGYREYLKTMNDWYNKGYIVKNFIDWDTDYDSMASYGMLYNSVYWGDTVGSGMSVFSFNKSQMVDSYKWAENPNYYRQAVPFARQTEDQTLHLGFNYTYAQTYPLAISTTCDDIELAIRFCDFLYTKDGFLFANYGIEGVTYNLDENGDPVSTELLLNSEYEYTQHKLANYCWRVGVYTYLQSKEDFSDPTIYECYNIWAENYDGAWMIPTGITMTVEESEDYSSRNNDITTYVEENLPRFVTGELNLEGDWDNFVNGIISMGVEDLCDIQEAALNRYNAR